MGITPLELKAMSVWEYSTLATYWIAAHETAGPHLSENEIDELWDWMQDKPDKVKSLAH